MAIELYPNLNYLLVLDHYDDITLFDDDVTPETVSYYQMKTSEDSISIDKRKLLNESDYVKNQDTITAISELLRKQA